MLLEKLFMAINETAKNKKVDILEQVYEDSTVIYKCKTKKNKEFDISFDVGIWEEYTSQMVEISWVDDVAEYHAILGFKVFNKKDIIEVSVEITKSTVDTWERTHKQLNLPFNYKTRDTSPESIKRCLGYQFKLVNLEDLISTVTTVRDNDMDLSPLNIHSEIDRTFRWLFKMGLEKISESIK